jgi:hypothetical protein
MFIVLIKILFGIHLKHSSFLLSPDVKPMSNYPMFGCLLSVYSLSLWLKPKINDFPRKRHSTPTPTLQMTTRQLTSTNSFFSRRCLFELICRWSSFTVGSNRFPEWVFTKFRSIIFGGALPWQGSSYFRRPLCSYGAPIKILQEISFFVKCYFEIS